MLVADVRDGQCVRFDPAHRHTTHNGSPELDPLMTHDTTRQTRIFFLICCVSSFFDPPHQTRHKTQPTTTHDPYNHEATTHHVLCPFFSTQCTHDSTHPKLIETGRVSIILDPRFTNPTRPTQPATLVISNGRLSYKRNNQFIDYLAGCIFIISHIHV